MLLGLRLENIALIESLDLSFNKGFSVFTGETGAGKSVFLFAIDHLLGGSINSSSGLMRSGSTQSLIEGCFSLDLPLKHWLIDNSFDTDCSEIFLSRDWRIKDGRQISRIRLNGEIINRKQLMALRPLLVDFASQGQVHALNSSTQQLRLLDQFGSVSIQNALELVKKSWNSWIKAKNKLNKAKDDLEVVQNEISTLNNFLSDLEEADIKDELEEQNLKKEQDRLIHGVRIQEILSNLFFRLEESSESVPSVLDHFEICHQELKTLIKLDSSFEKQFDNFLDIFSNLGDFLNELKNYQLELNTDSPRLEFIQSRLFEINRLKNRYNMDFASLNDRRKKAIKLLDSFNLRDSLDSLIQEERSAREDLKNNNHKLTTLRKIIAKKLENEIIKYMKPLGIDDMKFKVEFSTIIPSENGADATNFLFSVNQGQPLSNLSEIASGGERSRFLLALTTIFAEVTGTSTLIFDEIDSGVSGRISLSIAKLLKDLSSTKQIFCITHQPLVAASADHHFSVSKSVIKGQTHSKVLLLEDFQSRKDELAKLAGGNFEEASLYAASLLDNKAA